MFRTLAFLFAISMSTAAVAAGPTSDPFENLMQKGLLLGTQDLPYPCATIQPIWDCSPKKVLVAPLKAYLAQHPRDYDANQFLGAILLELGRPAEAIAPLKIAAAQHPEYQWSYTVLARAHDELGDQPTAVALMEASAKRPVARFTSDQEKSRIEYRYFDDFTWAHQIARQYRYYYLTGQADKAKALRASYPDSYASLITKEMTPGQAAVDLHEAGVSIWAEAAVQDMAKGDSQAARESLLNALSSEPDDEHLLYGLGAMSFNLNRYGDAAWAYRSALDRGLTMPSGSLVRMGVSYLVLGDYEKAHDAFRRASVADPTDVNARRWLIAAAYGVGGQKLALEAMNAAPYPGMPPGDSTGRRRETFNIVYGALQDADSRARRADLRYPRLGHLSLLHELLSDFRSSVWIEDKKSLERERWDLAWQTISIYRALPLKPQPPKRALEKELSAQQSVRSPGRNGGSGFDAALAATTIAPWWPEAHYNLAVLARDSHWTFNVTYDGEAYASNQRIAAQEFLLFLSASPKGPNAARVCKQLKEWGQQCPTP